MDDHPSTTTDVGEGRIALLGSLLFAYNGVWTLRLFSIARWYLFLPALLAPLVLVLAVRSVRKTLIPRTVIIGCFIVLLLATTFGVQMIKRAQTGPKLEASPFQNLSNTVAPDHFSSRWLSQYVAADGQNLLDKFTAADCLMDMSIAPDGTVSAALTAGCRSYRRTVVCRPDGTTSQRVSGPGGVEIVRFRADGKIVQTGDLRRETRLDLSA